MRKIEQQMNESIKYNKDWRNGNTRVENTLIRKPDGSPDNVSTVYLFGNKIAEIGDTWLTLFDGGIQSKTTKSRLNAILSHHGNGERIYQKDFEWFIATANGDIPFVSGIMLD